MRDIPALGKYEGFIVKSNIKIIFLLIGFAIMNPALASECDNACKKSLVDNYFSFLSNVYKAGSTPDEIEKLFSLFTSEVRYEHIEYQANFNKSEWRMAFTDNQKRGAYSASKDSLITAQTFIYGKNHVAVEYSYGEVSKEGQWSPKGEKNLLILFGFNESKINLVREYW
jgi:hypothetical protein